MYDRGRLSRSNGVPACRPQAYDKLLSYCGPLILM